MKDRALPWDECITHEREYEYAQDYHGLRVDDQSKEICLSCELPDCDQKSLLCGLVQKGFKSPNSKNYIKKPNAQYAQPVL